MDDVTAGQRQAQLLVQAMERDRFSLQALWSRDRGLGGVVEPFELEAYLHHCLRLPAFQRDLLVHAANDLLEAHHRPSLPYTRDPLHGTESDPRSKSPASRNRQEAAPPGSPCARAASRPPQRTA